MTTAHPDLHTLTGAYALNALDDDERAAFEAHLPDCDTCRGEVEGFLLTAAMLGSAVAEQPPAHLKGAILDTVARTRQEPPSAAPTAPWRVAEPTPSSRGPARRAWMDRLLMPAAAVMAIVVAGLSIVVGNLNRRLDEVVPSNEVAAVVAAEDLQTWDAELPEGGTARIVYSATRGEGWFVADGLGAVEAGRAYELWLIDDEGPSPAGLFDATDGVAAHSFTGDMTGVAAMAVTVEPASGSPQPTTDPIVVVEF